MARVRIPDEQRTLDEVAAVTRFLAAHGITYEQWQSDRPLGADASADDILLAYREKVDELKARGGYQSADVVDVKPDLPGLDAMLARFSREHWHDEDEVRFIVEGRGVFHIHPPEGPVFGIEVEAGDLIQVPRGTFHWFDLCPERRIRAIRLFEQPAGWEPHYTESDIAAHFEPVCFGASYFPREAQPN